MLFLGNWGYGQLTPRSVSVLKPTQSSGRVSTPFLGSLSQLTLSLPAPGELILKSQLRLPPAALSGLLGPGKRAKKDSLGCTKQPLSSS